LELIQTAHDADRCSANVHEPLVTNVQITLSPSSSGYR